jgi:hypothetical protein
MPEEQPAGTTAPASVSYVQQLIGPAAESVPAPAAEAPPAPAAEQPPAPGETTPPKELPAAETKSPAEQAEREQIIQEAAQQWGVDPNDPTHRRALERIADNQVYIRGLKAEIDQLKAAATAGTTQEDAALTEFERQLLSETEGPGEPAASPAAAPTKAVVPPATGPAPLLDLARAAGGWREPADAYREWSEAWARQDSEGNPSPDMATIDQIEKRQFMLRFGMIGVPVIERIIAERVQEALGRFKPDLERTIEERREQEAGGFARAELSKKPEGKKVLDDLFAEAKGPSIRFDGRDFANTALNRILIANPELLDIRAPHEDPDIALKLTLIKQYRAAARILRAQQAQPGVSPASAKELVAAGARMGAREALDSARHGMNAGAGAGGLAGRPGGGYIEELSKLPGQVSISTLVER